jgi:hypothetical protein
MQQVPCHLIRVLFLVCVGSRCVEPLKMSERISHCKVLERMIPTTFELRSTSGLDVGAL